MELTCFIFTKKKSCRNYYFKVTTEKWRLISAWSPVKFELHSGTWFAHYVNYCEENACKGLLFVLHIISRIQTSLISWEPGEDHCLYENNQQVFPNFCACAMHRAADKMAERVFHSGRVYITALLGTKMAEVARLVVLHLFCLNLALESWPCSLPHQSSSTSPTTTLAPGQLLHP